MATIDPPLDCPLPLELISQILLSTWLAEPSHRLRVNFMLVSPRFLEAAESTAALWSEIWEQASPQSLPTYMQRSRCRPIHLHLRLESTDDLHSANTKMSHVDGRLGKLMIRGNVHNINAFLGTHSMSSVEHIEIRQTQANTHLLEQLPKKGFEDCRNLRSLTLGDGLCLPRRPMLPKALTTLNIRAVPKLNALLYALSATCQLEHLSIGHTKISNIEPSKIVNLPHLQRLDASLVAGGNVATVFGSLSFPASTQVSLGLFITSTGIESLHMDVQAATARLHDLGTPLVAVESFAHGRHYERGTLAVRCFQHSLLTTHAHDRDPIFSIDMWWDNPWPIRDREFLYTLIGDALPTTHLREIALRLSASGPPLVNADERVARPHLGLLDVVRALDVAGRPVALLLSGHTNTLVAAASSLAGLNHIVVSAEEWHVADRGRLERLFEARRRKGFSDVTIDLLDGELEASFTGEVMECLTSASYIHNRDSDEEHTM
ncbi:unnamed protein product [Peniophora sp. CBMAI 1063]|nr:unnamed protein product [Peniophora sp. CBMAI 1063]